LTAPARLAAGLQGLARDARDFGCRAGDRTGCPSFPWQSVHARRAREARRDQDQVVEIVGFRFRKAGGNRTERTDRQWFPASATFQWRRFWGEPRYYMYPIRSGQDGSADRNQLAGRASRPTTRRRARPSWTCEFTASHPPFLGGEPTPRWWSSDDPFAPDSGHSPDRSRTARGAPLEAKPC